MLNASAPRTFRLLWSKTGQRRWYTRRIPADGLEQALKKLLARLHDDLGLTLEEFSVDHYVQEFGADGQQRALHTLTDAPQPFSVFFKNRAHPPNQRIDRHA